MYKSCAFYKDVLNTTNHLKYLRKVRYWRKSCDRKPCDNRDDNRGNHGTILRYEMITLKSHVTTYPLFEEICVTNLSTKVAQTPNL